MTTSTSPRVAVVILNWDGRHHLETYLPSVVEHSREHANVVVVDNGSTDDSTAWLKEHHPSVRVIELDENKGFAGGYNDGLERETADVFVLLNSDVRVSPNWIPPVLDMMQNEGYVACQPLIRNDTDPELFEYAGAAGGFIDRDGFTFCAGRIFEVFETDTGQYNANREVFWASGAALFIQAEAWREVGGLDEDFFAHMEEIDLCWRLKNRGYRIGACGQSVVFHLGGGTLQKISPFKSYLNFRNNLYMLVKNHHQRALYPMLFRRMVLDGVAALKFLVEGSTPLFAAVWKAHRDFKANFRTMKNRREQEIRACRSVQGHYPNRSGRYKGSILVDYFIRRKHTFGQLNPNRFWK
jgi:GT2 family glycosyltransferase